MKKFIKAILPLIFVAVVSLWLYKLQDDIYALLVPLFNNAAVKFGVKSPPCKNPIVYTLGTFDTKFGISKTYFLDALKEAEAIWEKPYGRELFTYQPDDTKGNTLKINLVYDYRQQATSKLASLGIVVQNDRASYDALKTKFTDLKTAFNVAKSDYDARAQSFTAEQKAYEDQVKYWNAQGGAPKKEYDQLQVTKSALGQGLSQLQSLQAKVNGMVDEMNALVVVVNRLADTLNLSVDQYNTVGASRGETFAEGVYQDDGINREIDIYEFSSRVKLVRVLAHELGHALDIGHLDDAKAMMYKFNQGSSKILSQADINALKVECGTN